MTYLKKKISGPGVAVEKPLANVIAFTAYFKEKAVTAKANCGQSKIRQIG